MPYEQGLIHLEAGRQLDRTDPARAAAFVDLSQMLMDSNEFLYIN